MIQGVALGFLTYLLFSSADASVKKLGGLGLSIFEIQFFITLVSFSTFGLGKPVHEKWSEVFKLNRPWLLLGRAFLGALAGLLGTYAFTTLPLAEAYALIFLMPAFTTLLSIIILGEPVGWRRSLAVVIGFAGVLLVVRPGFRELHLGHLAAAMAALVGALAMLALRALGKSEKRISVLAVVYTVVLLVDGPLMAWGFKVPTGQEAGLLLFAGLVGGIGQITMFLALRLTQATAVAPAQYSQIIWAVIFGAVFFGEMPDGIAFVGMALVVGSGLFTFFREEQLHQWSRKVIFMRNRA